jgi:hypothetical protein
MTRARAALALPLLLGALAGCGPDPADRAGDAATTSPGSPGSQDSSGASGTTDSSEPSDPDSGRGPLAGLTVALTGERPCEDARRSSLDEVIASGGVWMPDAPLARMAELAGAWSCAPDLPALQWPGVTILFLPGAPRGSARAFFEDGIAELGRGRVGSVLGGPALVLDAEGDRPAEVDVVMGDTHIVLVGGRDVTGEQLLHVARSMAPLH